jgi:hypothetical protein
MDWGKLFAFLMTNLDGAWRRWEVEVVGGLID